ncbi:MAG: histidine ammonia-lyase [Planctomycetes bacterium]|nr:histidine ammonia-lyase [Planctomycetota bacterium]
MFISLSLTGRGLTLDDAGAILGADRIRLRIASAAMAGVRASRAALERLLAEGAVIYGVNTGFGRLAQKRVAPGEIAALQVNLIRSHAAGVGEPLDPAVARLACVLRCNALVQGYSGVTPALVSTLAAMVNAGVVPVIPSQGSVGASGDLAPLAHLALVLIGDGEAWRRGRRMPGGRALRKAGLRPYALQAKEGLALINGTQITTAILAGAVVRARRLAALADLAGAMSLEALRGSVRPFDARLHAVRPQPGQIVVARRLRSLLHGSRILPSHRACSKVQDVYSLRCMPQVHGAVRDALAYVEGAVEREMNSATDNPLIFGARGGGEGGARRGSGAAGAPPVVISGGNFHAQPVALAADFLAIALTTLGGISERRIENLVNPDLSGMPPFLARHEGLNSGLMIAQVTAAALASENKTLAHPASADSIPTSANKEDYVSMGTAAARKCARVAMHTETILAIELLCAAQGLEFARPLRSGPAVEAAHAAIRRVSPPFTQDRPVAPEIEAILRLVRSGGLDEPAR